MKRTNRFIKNNLLVEVTSDRTLARLFMWALKHHSLISYSLYMGGVQAVQAAGAGAGAKAPDC